MAAEEPAFVLAGINFAKARTGMPVKMPAIRLFPTESGVRNKKTRMENAKTAMAAAR